MSSIRNPFASVFFFKAFVFFFSSFVGINSCEGVDEAILSSSITSVASCCLFVETFLLRLLFLSMREIVSVTCAREYPLMIVGEDSIKTTPVKAVSGRVR